MHTPSYITHPYNHPCFHHSNNVWCAKRTMKLVTMQFSPASCYFHPFKSKYSTHHPALKHTESTVSPQRATSFTSIQTRGKPTYFYILISMYWDSTQGSIRFWICSMHYIKINPISVSWWHNQYFFPLYPNSVELHYSGTPGSSAIKGSSSRTRISTVHYIWCTYWFRDLSWDIWTVLSPLRYCNGFQRFKDE